MTSGPRKQSRSPQVVSSSVWYYEEGRKLRFVVCTRGDCIQFDVPLAMLERSLKRSPKKRKRP
jgi:hypothetical protein